MALSVGDKFGLYEILAPVGAGGMGAVCKTVQPHHRYQGPIDQFTEQCEAGCTSTRDGERLGTRRPDCA
jgi:hypothetical protein